MVKDYVYDRHNRICNSNFGEMTKKEMFPNENELFKLLYLRIKQLNVKWETAYIANV